MSKNSTFNEDLLINIVVRIDCSTNIVLNSISYINYSCVLCGDLL